MIYPVNPKSISGSVYGLALGDAWGKQTEFWTYDEIIGHFSAGVPLPNPALITDDTQMSLYAIRALAEWHTDTSHGYPDDLHALGTLFGEHFIDWMHDPDNNRAPGMTCMRSLRALARAGADQYPLTTARDSKGCGANMRAPWIGLDFRIPDDEVDEVAMLQALITHGHSTALVAAAVTANLTRIIAQGKILPGEYTEAALALASDHGESGQEVVDALKKALAALRSKPQSWDHDPCRHIGQGWVADEALAVAVYVADLMAGQAPEETLKRGAATNGDSDSIACLAGAFRGASGVEWDTKLIDRLEPRYQNELASAVRYLHGSLES
jgi:ADP-ribosylglycohydrolase